MYHLPLIVSKEARQNKAQMYYNLSSSLTKRKHPLLDSIIPGCLASNSVPVQVCACVCVRACVCVHAYISGLTIVALSKNVTFAYAIWEKYQPYSLELSFDQCILCMISLVFV